MDKVYRKGLGGLHIKLRWKGGGGGFKPLRGFVNG